MIRNILSYSVLILSLLFAIGIAAIYLVPWYTLSPVLEVKHQTYNPGGTVCVKFTRNALINMRAVATRELVRVDSKGAYHEEAKVTWAVNIEKGKRTIWVSYPLPDCCDESEKIRRNGFPCVYYEENTYRFTGNTTYKVLGLINRTVYWESNSFRIELVG